MVHDNTEALQKAISDIVSTGGDYLDLPSGTYLTNKLSVPTNLV